MRILVAPDSFKGSATATDAARAIARGWAVARPEDELVILPQADGGEGTLEALATAIVGSRFRTVGPLAGPGDSTVEGVWLELPDGAAVVELAAVCGLPLYNPRDPLGASTFALGEVLAAVVAAGVDSVMVALGGSASTDGGAGALRALGLRLRDAEGAELLPGGGALVDLAAIDRASLRPPPPGGVRLLTDVTAPLLGAAGAAAVFGPQKGASATDVELLERGLGRLALALGGNPEAAGAGAAGGTAYGLASAWGARIVDGAAAIAQSTGLLSEISRADILITGEGQFDDTSLAGKVVGHALGLAPTSSLKRIVIAGRLTREPPDAIGISLEHVAGSGEAAMTQTEHWLEVAGSLAAQVA